MLAVLVFFSTGDLATSCWPPELLQPMKTAFTARGAVWAIIWASAFGVGTATVESKPRAIAKPVMLFIVSSPQWVPLPTAGVGPSAEPGICAVFCRTLSPHWVRARRAHSARTIARKVRLGALPDPHPIDGKLDRPNGSRIGWVGWLGSG